MVKDSGTFKICTKCKVEKPISAFNKNSNPHSDGYQYYCRDCQFTPYAQKKERYYLPNRERILKRTKELDNNYKYEAYLRVGRGSILCACGCGCDDIRFLEINHKNGGGNREHAASHTNRGRSWYRQIVRGERSVEDLELACKPYNAGVHALMLKYRLDKTPFKITYIKP